jgi:hypothetical protein
MYYRKPYPEYFDQVQLPHRYKIPDFTKFIETDSVSTREHISRYIIQLGEATSIQELKVRLFPLSLSEFAFSWFSLLPQGSIGSWEELEGKFHQYFYSSFMEKNIGDLVDLRQRNSELGIQYLQRFREIRNQCYTLALTEEELICIAIRGLQPMLREKVTGIEFQNLGMLASQITSILHAAASFRRAGML